ncbi:DUF402 domain-containing protein [Hyperthermus butylicus]|uniref:Probable ribonuclease FAU-1 n=1 Tax=Hyperthermus butylicus (strain DSM 5456 / JCM 9403 / PLM1-5) TaxID=415426 RepID=FAU1_HYPBU|nr:DUF402 domain-containing protein [Hyperthermus butylicus]A2BN82.1 RecName: Full=Probable ribonuclease FAU-1; AltName: Full=RNA-binding protein FAU-1 [Hyperthermus butylicus DSM 5456]ABM81443.1 conserved archaeal protein [Hyperthermus butylicus DSM 5456]
MATPARRIPRVRVRGIYATALTKLVIDMGFQVVQPSRIIADRFSLPMLTLPADVTIKDSDNNPSELLIVGYEWAVNIILEKLRDTLPYSFYWRSSLPLHSTVKARVIGLRDNRCIARVGDVEAELLVDRSECIEDREVVGGVVRPGVKPRETPRIVPGARVIGDYAILIESSEPRVTISEHVRSPEKRALLAAIATSFTEQGYAVHWRSSSQHAEREELEKHLRQLREALAEARKRAEEGPPGVYSEGEAVVLVHLSSADKQKLDEIRDSVVATIPYHHTVKSLQPSLSKVIDYAEKVKALGVDSEKLVRALLELVAEDLASRRRIRILHVKPSGEYIELGKAEIKSVYVEDKSLVIVLERTVKSRGVYDGLGVEKEPGDRIVTEVRTDEWIVKHTYYAPDGTVKGTYININTPPEIAEDAIVYLDLEIDIVKKPGKKPKIVDAEELDKYHEQGIVTTKLKEKALEIARKLAG